MTEFIKQYLRCIEDTVITLNEKSGASVDEIFLSEINSTGSVTCQEWLIPSYTRIIYQILLPLYFET